MKSKGGARVGAGRKKEGIESKSVLVPIDLIPRVKEMISEYKSLKKAKQIKKNN